MSGWVLSLLSLFLAPALLGAEAPASKPESMRPPSNQAFAVGKFEWARLQTESPFWKRHSERDRYVIDLMRRETSLQIGSAWHSARAAELRELTEFPFLFAQSIAALAENEATALAEYLRRGGFLLIDACIDTKVNPDWESYLANQLKTLSRLFPGVRVVALKSDHEIFSSYFRMTRTPPQTASRTKPAWANHSTEPLRGVFLGDRMVGIISLSGFQCGFASTGETATDAVKMVSNIYVYAMTH
jgi:hypothetical protein